MINLLPPKEKEGIISERNEKLAVVLGNLFIISLVCLALVLISLKFYILSEDTYSKINLESVKEKYQTSEFLSLKESIQKYNADLIKIDDFYKKEIYFSDALKVILNTKRPSGLYLNSINISEILNIKESDRVKAVISGVSNTRDDLQVFRDNLENNKKIVNVYFPPNSWVKPADVNFSITLEILRDENQK